MDTKHIKLVGGSLNTARHDRQRMDEARRDVQARIEAERARAKR